MNEKNLIDISKLKEMLYSEKAAIDLHIRTAVNRSKREKGRD
jgi:hypothetical protein